MEIRSREGACSLRFKSRAEHIDRAASVRVRDGGIAVNSINPGYTATDLNDNSRFQTVEEGAREIVRLALLDHPVTGKFLETGGGLLW